MALEARLASTTSRWPSSGWRGCWRRPAAWRSWAGRRIPWRDSGQVGAQAVDVLFLDIHMPGLSGFQVVERVPPGPAVVFTTAHDEHAVQAFEADAVDYLLKPVQQERLEAALARVAARRGTTDSARLVTLLERIAAREPGGEPPRVTARSGKVIRVFDAREIGRFRASDRYTLFQHAGAEFVLDESLNTLETRLGPHGFFRAHRAELLNLRLVQAVSLEEGACQVTLRDGQAAPVSRRLVPELKRRLGIAERS